MKLQILPAKQGLLWVRLGIRTFWRQPLAMTGQFFLFMGLLSLCSLIPFIGSFVGLALLPMASLGLMAATREAHVGNFPMPHLLWLGLRSGAETRRHMAVLGGLYAVGFCAVLALAAISPKLAMGSKARPTKLPMNGMSEHSDSKPMNKKNCPVMARGWRQKVRMPRRTQSKPCLAGRSCSFMRSSPQVGGCAAAAPVQSGLGRALAACWLRVAGGNPTAERSKTAMRPPAAWG